MTPKPQRDLVHEVLAYGAYAAGALVLTSLVLSLVRRLEGAPWAEVGAIGDFWGGHLNGLALVFLAVSFLLQQREFRHQARQVERQNALIGQQVRSQQLQLILERLRDESADFRFAIEEGGSPAVRRTRTIQVGLTDFAVGLATSDTSARYIPDMASVLRIAGLYRAGWRLLELSEDSQAPEALQEEVAQQADKLILESLVPGRILGLADQEQREREEQHTVWLAVCGDHDFPPAIRRRVASLIAEGWTYLLLNNSGSWVASLSRDMLDREVIFDSGAAHANPIDAVQLALENLDQARIDGV